MLAFMAAIFATAQERKTLHSFTATTIDGKPFDMASLKGKKVLVVNVASRCGLTPQYGQLEELYEKYKDSNFEIVAFPANNFKEQEPGTNEEIAQFCSLTYGVTFPMMEKTSVAGDDMNPVYRWLTSKSENGVEDAPVQWNFQKFMIDEEGRWAGMVPPMESPLCDKIVNWIEGR